MKFVADTVAVQVLVPFAVTFTDPMLTLLMVRPASALPRATEVGVVMDSWGASRTFVATVLKASASAGGGTARVSSAAPASRPPYRRHAFTAVPLITAAGSCVPSAQQS
jgi:hypothetical protein